MVYGVWLRRKPNDWQAFQDDLAKLFDAGPLEELPERIKAGRCEASNRDDRHPFRNLSLFFDEPLRNPWRSEAIQVGQKVEAGLP